LRFFAVIYCIEIDLEDYNCSLPAVTIRHALNKHGDEASESKHGQRAITADDFLKIPTIIQEYDTVELSPEHYKGREVFLFRKESNGRTTVVTYDSKRHTDLTIQTMYANKSGSLATSVDVNASTLTSETTRGTAST